MQIIIVAMLVGIVFSLGHGLTSLSSGPECATRMAQALTVRITLSVALFCLLIAGYHFGWIEPHGVR